MATLVGQKIHYIEMVWRNFTIHTYINVLPRALNTANDGTSYNEVGKVYYIRTHWVYTHTIPSCQMSSSKWQKLPPKHTAPGQESSCQSKTIQTNDKVECLVEN